MSSRPEVSAALAMLRAAAPATHDPEYWSRVHNYEFDERLDATRLQAMAPWLTGSMTPDDLREAHARYVKNFVTIPVGSVPDTFLPTNALAHRPELSDSEWVVRGENITWRLRWPIDHGFATDIDGAFDWLQRCHSDALSGDSSAIAQLENWIEAWSVERDARPMFASTEGGVFEELSGPDWAEALRVSLGLDHWRPRPPTPLYIALMRYRVQDIRNAVARLPKNAAAFSIPTAFDQPQWPWFFPSPVDSRFAPNDSYGRSLRLEPIGDWALLRPEFLHVRIDYEPIHLHRFARVTTQPPAHGLKELRNAHLDAVRFSTERYDFGEYVP